MGTPGREIAEGEVVYAVESGGLVKIGTTTNLPSRLRNLAGMNAGKVEFLGSCPGGRAMEASFHREFRPEVHHGEWFGLSTKSRQRLMERLSGATYVVRLPPALKKKAPRRNPAYARYRRLGMVSRPPSKRSRVTY